MSDIKEWHVDANDNTASTPNGAPEGMAAQTFNNVIREAMAAIKRNWGMTHSIPDDDMGYGRVTAQRITQVTLAGKRADRYYNGLSFRCRIHAAHDGSTTPTLKIGLVWAY